ncbi:MAG: rhomboid family intramembrane serine protease [Thermoproteota archaeon]|nr:MAG: rhomboid family intramembrane serine protease [Candidatus Korarchaeota archaeon]RLG56190.1 MAG: rhomboid family intramembrane serine protease [Candidatus Korarchaeota archaeon]
MIPLRDINRPSRRPVVTPALIAINVVVFLWEVVHPRPELARLFLRYGFTPYYFISKFHRLYYTPITSMFLHGDWMHLLGNMLYLYIFGDNIEDACGRAKYVLFYMLSGLGATFFHFVINMDSRVPAVGASGAISGILGAYFLLYPNAKIETLVFYFRFIPVIYYISARWYIGFWFIMQLLLGLLAPEASIAFWAHVGGFLTGLALIKLFARRRARAMPVEYYTPPYWYG